MGAPPTNKETLSLPAIRSESLGSSKFKLKLKNNNTMKESIMSFFNAPITNQVPNGVVSIIQLHAYISANGYGIGPSAHVPHLTTRSGSPP